MVEALTWWAQPRGGCRPAERKCWGSPGRMVTGSGGVVKGPHSGVWEASRVALWARLGVEPGDGAHHLPTELPPRLWGDCRCWGSDANGPRSAAPARPPRRGDLSLPQVPPQLPVLPPQCVCFPVGSLSEAVGGHRAPPGSGTHLCLESNARRASRSAASARCTVSRWEASSRFTCACWKRQA